MPSHNRPSYLPSIIKESFQSISRNTLISIAAIVSIIATLLILGIFIIFSVNVSQLTQVAEENSEIQIFLLEGVTQEQKDNLLEILENDERVSEVTYESKEEALENFSKSLNNYQELLGDYTEENNPLPESFIVKTYNIEDLAAIRDLANEYKDEVEYVRYQESFINSLSNFTQFIRILSIGLIAIMSVIAFFLIYNTIRLTVANRRKEISIMKSIGATNSYIQIPFILEGTFIGLISAFLSVLLVILVYYYVIGYLSGNLIFSTSTLFISPRNIIILILISFTLYGAIIGSIGAAFATRRYLEV